MTLKPLHPMPDGFKREDLLACLNREIAMRQSLYPEWVAAKKMSKADAERELGMMEECRKAVETVAAAPLLEATIALTFEELRKWGRFDALMKEIGLVDIDAIKNEIKRRIEQTVYEPEQVTRNLPQSVEVEEIEEVEL
jgi:hypothetical protein